MLANVGGCKAGSPVVCRILPVAAALVLALQSAPVRAAAPDSHGVTLSIANDGPEAVRCLILFAHWVATEAGTIPRGAELAIAMSRQDSDGALWIPRADGRRMMIETIACGAASNWAATRGQVPLLPARAGRETNYRTTCHLDGAVFCTDPAPPQ